MNNDNFKNFKIIEKKDIFICALYDPRMRFKALLFNKAGFIKPTLYNIFSYILFNVFNRRNQT